MSSEPLHPADAPPPGSIHRLRRAPAKGAYDRPTIDAILDATPFCHLGYVHQGRPVVIPTLQVRVDDHLYVHASSGGRMGIATAAQPLPVCVTVTLIDGLVMARSGFHHSVNHRSVVVHGDAVRVVDGDEQLAALEAVTNSIAPGRWDELRPPTTKELIATAVVRVGLDQASAKIRTGPPVDEEEDYSLDTWAGVVPVTTAYGMPVPDPLLDAGIQMSMAVRSLVGRTPQAD